MAGNLSEASDTLLGRVFPGDSEMARRMRAHDWSATHLGPPASWPAHLRVALGICLSSHFPTHLVWGPELIFFYNDACIPLLGRGKHPDVLGRPIREAWAASWPRIGPVVEKALTTGTTSASEALLLGFGRELAREEAHVTLSFSPIFGEGGAVEGLFCACAEAPERRPPSALAELDQATAAPPPSSRARAKEAFRTSEERYRALFTSIDEGFSVFEVVFEGERPVDLRWLEANPAAVRMSGANALVEKTVREVAPASASRWLEAFSRVARTGVGERCELPGELPGRIHDVYVFKTGPAHENKVAALVRDVTRRKRREQHEAMLSHLSRELVGWSNVEDTMRRIGEQIGRHLDVKQCMFAEEVDEHDVAVVAYGWSAAGVPSVKGVSYRMQDFFSEEHLAQYDAGQPSVVSDTQSDPRVSAAGYGALGIRSFIAISRVREGQRQLQMAVLDDRIHTWSADDVAFVREIAERIWLRLERARAEEKLRESEAREAFLVRLGDALRVKMDADAIERVVTRMLVEHLDVEQAHFAHCWDDVSEVRHEFRRGGRSFLGRYSRRDWPGNTELLHSGHAVVISDVNVARSVSEEERAAWTAIGLVSQAAIPTLRDGRLLGTLSLCNSKPRIWTAPELDLLRETAGRSWEAIEHARAEAALRASEAKYRTLFDSMDEGYCIMQLIYDAGKPNDLWFLQINRAFERNTGLANAEGKTIRELAPAIESKWMEIYDRVVHTGAPLRFESDSPALGRFFSLYAFRIGEPHERKVAVIFTDITERKRIEEALRESEERLRMALTAGAMGTWLYRVPQDEQILDESMHHLAGLPQGAASMPLETFLQVVHEDDVDRVRAEFDRCLREGHELDTEFRVRWPDGSEHWLKDRGRVFPDPEGRPLFFAGAAVDITDRKRMEEELHEADRGKNEFLAMLGHELRNPLAPLRGVMDTLQRQKLDGPALERAYAMMDRQVTHLHRLVDDLLDVSRITRGLVELRKEPVSLAEMAERAIEMVTPAVEGRGHDLHLSLPRKPVWVEGDPTRLTQVIFNLLNNAAKYTDPGGKIWLAVEREGEQAVVRVRDNGTGMKPDLVLKVFDLFTQGERTLDRSQGGLGLGLTLVKRLVEMHGGTVEAWSAGPDRGSELIVHLPALPALPAGATKPPSPRPAVTPPSVKQVSRALIVDDVPDIAEGFSWMLEGLALEVKVAHSGAEAVELAHEFLPDLILCDLGMPGMDGYETCRRLRRLPGLEKAVITAVSGYEEQRQRSQEAGFDRHLVKPIGRAVLEELVKSTAAKR